MFEAMKEPRITIDWMRNFANSPRIILHGYKHPEFPAENEPIWERSPNGFHLARKGDFAFYFYTDGKPTSGYAGRRFAGTLKTGETFEYKGAWSSRAGCINDEISAGNLSGEYIIDISCGSYATACDIRFINKWFYEPLITFRRNNGKEIVFEPAYKGKFKGDEGFEYPPE